MEKREELGKRLVEHCPVAEISAAGPWEYKSERDRESWRVLADLALAWRAPTVEDIAFVKATDVITTLLRDFARLDVLATALRRYVRHANACARRDDRSPGITVDVRTPCTCGLAALLDKTP
jgi:hypothetical protein